MGKNAYVFAHKTITAFVCLFVSLCTCVCVVVLCLSVYVCVPAENIDIIILNDIYFYSVWLEEKRHIWQCGERLRD